MVTTTQTARITPPHFLVHSQPSKPTWLRSSPEASSATIKDVENLLGVPVFRLGKLLGLQSPMHIYNWTAKGKGFYRPSHLMMMRMFRLIKLKYVEGIEIWRVKSIDWEKGTAEFYDEGADFDLASEQNVPVAQWRFTG